METTNLDLQGLVASEGYSGVTSPHGTNVAGLIAARRNNDYGIAGGAPTIVVPVQFDSDLSEMVTALQSSMAHDVAIANVSGGQATDAFIAWENVCAEFYNSNRILVASAGNGDIVPRVAYPARYSSAWAVSGIWPDGQRSFNSVGPEVDFTCFASDQYTTRATGNTGSAEPCPGVVVFGGTSAAAPVVASAAALLLYCNAGLYNDDVYNLLAMSASRDGLQPDGFSPAEAFGHGLIQAGSAIDSLLMNAMISGTAMGSSRTVTADLGVRAVRNSPNPVDLPNGNYAVTRYECERDISFPASFVGLPKVWGRGVDTSGMVRVESSGSRMTLDHKRHCDVRPGSVTLDGCTLVTYVYRLVAGASTRWYPAHPDSVTWGWAALGKDGVAGVGNDTDVMAAHLRVSPNPFNARTIVSFNNARAGKVDVSIFDVRGRRCATLHDGMLAAGRHEFVWSGLDSDGRLCASAVYFVRVADTDGSTSRRLVLLK